MSAKDTKMVPPDGGGTQAEGCNLEEVQDGGGMEKVASSPDSAIDLTEDAKSEAEIKVEDFVSNLLDEVLTEVTQVRRHKKKKRARFTESEKWEHLKDCSLVGWKRILARTCDDGDGWGFNFVAPTGVRLTARELEKFLKKRRLSMESLSFVARGQGEVESHLPRKIVKWKMGYSKHKIRDLQLSKPEELRRRKLAAQTRLEERMALEPQFKSISEFLASLDGSQSSSCSDLSRLTPDIDSEVEEAEEEVDMWNKSLCQDLVNECVSSAWDQIVSRQECSTDTSFETSSPSPNKDIRIISLQKSIKEVKLRLSGMLLKESQESPKKLKINIGERPIEKLKITPERLKNNSPMSIHRKSSPTKLKIKLPKENPTPERIKLTIRTPQGLGHKGITAKIKKKKREKSGDKLDFGETRKISPTVLVPALLKNKPKKYSIFKTRNKQSKEQSSSLIKFTDRNTKKSLNVRKSIDEAPETLPIVELKNSDRGSSPEGPLKIVIETESEDGVNLQDEFARAVKQESPRGKVTSYFSLMFVNKITLNFYSTIASPDASGRADSCATQPLRPEEYILCSLPHLP